VGNKQFSGGSEVRPASRLRCRAIAIGFERLKPSLELPELLVNPLPEGEDSPRILLNEPFGKLRINRQ